jgi:predicted ATPase
MPLRVTVENFRCLARADWTLEPGVSLFVGPNGSGKTTLLEVPALLKDALQKGTQQAVDEHGGPGTIVNLRATSAEHAVITAIVEDQSWELVFWPRGGSVTVVHEILVGEKQVVESTPPLLGLSYVSTSLIGGSAFTPTAYRPHVALETVGAEAKISPELKVAFENAPELVAKLCDSLGTYLVHGGYWVRSLRVNGSRTSSDARLDRDGTNAFAVLRNWRDARATRPRWDFVVAGLKEAFPEAFEELEFESAGQTIAAKVFAPRTKESIGAYFAPDGLLTGLLHLTAVASTPDGGAIAIDEFENSLHPYAIRALLEHIRAWASQHQISVTLATHSPVLIDQFKQEPERLLVMDPSAETVPVPISKLRDPEWLSHFSLGDLYASGEFGPQAPH